ncbi:MalY/PatB family protein [Nakamurella flava]|nr:aminotransferase class I/II-fold pyridoxal phosphate-dependent enzyme [Nakamurella flava]
MSPTFAECGDPRPAAAPGRDRPGPDIGGGTDALTPDDLRARGSLKWTATDPGDLGAWVAEMDLPLAPAIRRTLHDAIEQGLTGYLPPAAQQAAERAAAAWQHRRYGWAVDPADVHLTTSVLRALQVMLDHLTPPGTPVVLPVPAYMPFLDVPALAGRELRTVPMTHTADGAITFDLDAIAAALVPGAVLVLTNPHNPTGRVFTAAELRAVADVVDAAGALVFADEIHAPVVFDGRRHVPYATVSDRAAEHTVTGTSASKGWNIAGLGCAQLIVSGAAMRERWATVPFLVQHGVGPLGALATAAAYDEGQAHLDATVGYLQRGRDLFVRRLAEVVPTVPVAPIEGTYLAWVDLRSVDRSVADLQAAARVRGVDGQACGAPGFLRLNLALPHPLVGELADRLGRAIDA